MHEGLREVARRIALCVDRPGLSWRDAILKADSQMASGESREWVMSNNIILIIVVVFIMLVILGVVTVQVR
jgi:hypothetical protein